ncbi:MAG: ParB/RepB/Spo0J family partition protein [Ruminococcaceae bacterium]|nr:ParB/RepB/Spo0J family partition protein [Oscillospiraceae bacterium]
MFNKKAPVKKQTTQIKESDKHSSLLYEKNHIYDVDISLVIPNPMQPRKKFDDVALAALADSIKKHGLLQPISVRMITKANGDIYFELIAGERRLRAMKMLGEKEIAARIIDMTENESGEMALIENIMREELNIFEYAAMLKKLIEKYEVSQEALAERLSTSQSNIANKLRLLKLSPEERELICENRLTERHARAVLRIESGEKRLNALKEIIKQSMNVHESEIYCERIYSEENADKKKEPSRKTKYYIKDIRIFCNTIDKALESMKNAGIVATSVKNEKEGSIEIVITIPKASGKTTSA